MVKHTVGVALGILALTCGLGAGAANAQEAPQNNQTTTTPLSIRVNVADLQDALSLPDTNLPATPSPEDVLLFLHNSIVMVGRDVLARNSQESATLMADSLVQDTRDGSDGSGLLGFIPLPTPNFIKNMGVDIDGMWAVVATSASRVPIIGEWVYDYIEGVRTSKYWKSDYYRAMRTWAVFTVIAGTFSAPVIGLAAAIVISLLLVFPITIVLLTGAIIFGILALPFAVVNGIIIMVLGGISWLLGTAAGIGLIVLGALLVSGVLDLFAGISLGLLFWLAPVLAIVNKVLGALLIIIGVVVLVISMAALVAVIVGALMVLAPWLALAGIFILAAAIFVGAFLIALLLVGPIALVTIPLSLVPFLLAAGAMWLMGFILYGLFGDTNKGPQAKAVNKSEERRAAENKSKKNKKGKKAGKKDGKKGPKGKKGKDGKKSPQGKKAPKKGTKKVGERRTSVRSDYDLAA